MKKKPLYIILLAIASALLFQSDVIPPTRIPPYDKKVIINGLEQFPQYALIAIERNFYRKNEMRIQRVVSGAPIEKKLDHSRFYLIACPVSAYPTEDTLSSASLKKIFAQSVPVLIEDTGVKPNDGKKRILSHSAIYKVHRSNSESLILVKEKDILDYSDTQVITLYTIPD